MKLLLTTLLLGCLLCARSQSVTLRGGHTLTPSDYVSLGYEQPTNTSLNYSLRAFLESSRRNNLNYSAYGLELLAVTQPNLESTFSFRGGFGATAQIEREPWVYKTMSSSQKLNYGLIAEASGIWLMTDAFSLELFAQQKYLFNSALGRLRFGFGIGLTYHFNNY
jgi:hypothetical protein